MAHAWLDSLSEDWVSQPGSNSSQCQLPPLKGTGHFEAPPSPEAQGDAHGQCTNAKQSCPLEAVPGSPQILFERSTNDINISTRRLLSKDAKPSPSEELSRLASNVTTGSVVYNSNQTQGSLVRAKTETPEWKQRLVQGKATYGEVRDLFSSTATGLQGIFKPPRTDVAHSRQPDDTLPSSPPRHADYTLENGSGNSSYARDGDEPTKHTAKISSPDTRWRQREIKYKLNISETSASSDLQSSDRKFLFSSENHTASQHCSKNDPSASHRQTIRVSRKASGQSDFRHEDFSPILIGKCSDSDGRIDFAPIEMPVDQLKQKLEHLRANQMLLDSQAGLQPDLNAKKETSTHLDSTEEYMRKGGFVTLQRGDMSRNGSFYDRRLSPDMDDDTSDIFPEESLQASTPKQFPTGGKPKNLDRPSAFNIGQSPSLPRAPFPSPEKRVISRENREHAMGSPLKLFGPYDTFTNKTLLRRISQLEGKSSSNQSSRQSSSTNDQIHAHNLAPLPGQISPVGDGSAINQFDGQSLDGYEFTSDLSHNSNEVKGGCGKSGLPAPIWPTLLPPGVQPPREFAPGEVPELVVRRRRDKSPVPGRSTAVSKSATEKFKASSSLPTLLSPDETPKRDSDEGKRPRASPSKDPTPKRRRTLHGTDISFRHEENFSAVDSAHHHMQSVIGKKRKDARPGGFALADADVLASRSILQPRTPTPSAKVSQREKSRAYTEGEAGGKETGYLPSDSSAEGQRKPSIRTQDFVDQAAQIMAMIRSQVKPGLASLEESRAEINTASECISLTDSYQESTNEPLSRPPSREGRPVIRVPRRQENPEVVDRLKKYQEPSNTDEPAPSSKDFKDLDSNDLLAAREPPGRLVRGKGTKENGPVSVQGDIVSDMANVRITASRPRFRDQLSPERDISSQSSAVSGCRTFQSTSSRGSDSRRTIMPQSVSHLIPDKVGRMYLDKQNNLWIKKKDPMATALSQNTRPSEDSEDDPFANIPDLSVDMAEEMQNLVAAVRADTIVGGPTLNGSPGNMHGRDNEQVRESSPDKSEKFEAEIATASQESENHLDCSAHDPSPLQGHDRNGSGPSNLASEPRSLRRRRYLTISFSSPVASIIKDNVVDRSDTSSDQSQTADEHPDIGPANSVSILSDADAARTINRYYQTELDGGSELFVPRPVSRIDEQDEESTVELHGGDDRQLGALGEISVVSHGQQTGDRHASLSLIINETPNKGVLAAQADDSAMIGRNVGKLSLSPLSEFTLNNADQSFGLEVSYVLGRRHLRTGGDSKKVLSMTIRELVDRLGVVEPYEPFWEDITELDLHGQQLSSLHMLDEFCGKVVTLDASENKLEHLDGIPSGVRQLKASCNLLTELTAWDHLMNLQYVDVSGNEVKSLSALKNLVHLRSIKADDNQLTTLDGLDAHDGLLSLRARNNLIENVDFSVVFLERLTDLDLGNNRIKSLQRLELLPSLSRLRIPRNQLSELRIEKELAMLRHLDVSDNELETLDLGKLPMIQTVYADRNRLHHLTGFERAPRLDSLSLREQSGGGKLDLGFLRSAYEVRKLFLSGNYLRRFEPTVDFLNLQLLDLANCGLQSLPEKMGQLMPNLRTLNVNLNAVSDLGPLRYIPRLKKLLAAGNRLKDSAAVTQLLTEFPHLRQLDLRDNPVTLGLYPPTHVLASTSPDDRCGFADSFTLPEADVERDGVFAARLDEETRLRRRLHQILLVAGCARLRKLDGLPVNRHEMLAKDDYMQRLMNEGLLVGIEPFPVPGTREEKIEGTARAEA